MADVSPVARYAFEFYKKKGLSDIAAAGFVGNLMGESQINPQAMRKNDAGPGIHSYGIGQWNRERYAGLQKLAAERGTSWDDLDTQLEWGWQEMNTTEAGTIARLRAAKDVDQATDAGIMYERPQGSQNGPRAGHNWSGRNANARALLGMGPSAEPAFVPTVSTATTPYNPTTINAGPNGIQPVNATLFPNLYNEQVPQTQAPGLYKTAPSFMDMMDAAPKELGYYHAYNFLKAESEVPDQNWLDSRTLDTFKQMPGYQGLSQEWQSWVIENSVSPTSAEQKIEWAMDQTNATDTLDRGGWTGLGVRMLAGVTDPTTWALELGTGGVGATASIGSRLLRGGAEGARQGGIFAGTQAIKLETTPTYTVRDLAVDSAIGMALGSAFGSLAAKTQHVDPTLARDTQELFANHAMSMTDDVKAAMGGERSVGAAEAGAVPYAYTQEGIARAQAALAQTSGALDKIRIDAHAAGVATNNSAIVATMDSLMPNPVGNGGIVSAGKVDAWTWMDKEIKGAQSEWENSFEDAFTQYLEEQSNGRGGTIFDINTKLSKRTEFELAIMDAVETADKSQLPQSLQRGAEAYSRNMQRVLKAVQQAGYEPAQGIEHSATYTAKNKNRENFRASIATHGYDGVVEGVARAMDAQTPDAGLTFASRIAHREARIEAGWAVGDARQDVINGIKDDLKEDVEEAVAARKADDTIVKAEKDAEIEEINRVHKETLDEAERVAQQLKDRAKEILREAKDTSVERAARLQAEAAELRELADETVKGAKEATKEARKKVNEFAKGRKKDHLDTQKAKIADAKKVASNQAVELLEALEPKLIDVWNTTYKEAADSAYKRAAKLWNRRRARKYVDIMNKVNEKNDILFVRGFGGEDREALRQWMIEGGMLPEEADMEVALLKGPNEKGVRNTRHRTAMDYDMEIALPTGSFRAKDLFERNASVTADQYRRSMLSAGALAKAGFSSEAAARAHVMDVTDVEKLRRAGQYVSAKQEAAYLKARDTMLMYIDRITGKPESNPDSFKKLKSVGRTFRNLSFASFMVMNGISQLGDAPKILARNGLAASFAHFDLGDIFRVFRTGTKGRSGNELAEGLEVLTGQGSNTSRTRVFTAYDGLEKYYGESWTEKALGRAEHISKGMASATSLIGMSAPVTDFLTRWSMRSTLQAFVNHAQGTKLISQKILNDSGFTDAMADNLRNMIKSGAIELADTGVVKKLHLEKLDRDWYKEIDELMANVTREAKVQVLEASPAHLPKYMQNDLGRLLGQFKTFMIASYASNSLRGIRMHDATAASSLIMSSVMGAATYAMTIHMKSFGMSEEKREEYLDKYLYSRKGITNSILGRSGDLAVLPFVVDSMLAPVSLLAGEDMRMFDGSRTSGLGTDLITGLPAYRMFQQLEDLTFGSLKDAMRSDQHVTQGEAMSRASTVIPWLKTYGILNATQALLSHLPAREPRDETFTPDN
ncbi:phage tail tip lysozyme